jgi:hypothetical protein
VDPFDQPNVEESKELTRRVLAGESDGDGDAADADAAPADAASADAPRRPGTEPAATGDLVFHPDAALQLTSPADATFAGELRRHLERRRPSAYLALQAFLAPSPDVDAALARIRARLRDATRCATTAGYGPRYLHSTGQLHKGGPPIGWFLQLTDDHGVEREIPGWPYTFGQLIDAQARGDLAALEAHDLPVARIHLGPDAAAGLAALEAVLDGILEAPHG